MPEQDVEVSADCLDILTRVLVAQPGERMSMDEIKTHRWFLKGLPPGALEMNDFLLQGLASQEEVDILGPVQLVFPPIETALPAWKRAPTSPIARQ